LCISQTDYFSQDDLSKFGYTSNMKEEILNSLFISKSGIQLPCFSQKYLLWVKILFFMLRKCENSPEKKPEANKL